jgi:hypothetical protein
MHPPAPSPSCKWLASQFAGFDPALSKINTPVSQALVYWRIFLSITAIFRAKPSAAIHISLWIGSHQALAPGATLCFIKVAALLADDDAGE